MNSTIDHSSGQEGILFTNRFSHWLDGAWIAFVCLMSQLPYRLVWQGKFTFVYDAFTTFSPWNVARLGDLRKADGLLSLFQESFPGEIWPSYFFSGFLRQLAALVQANTAIAHAQVQALHALLLVPATGLLFRSLGVRFRYGIVGGLVFSLSGINLSLAQHVLSYEALLYLVLSLWGLRELTRLGKDCDRTELFLWSSFCAVALTSLVRIHHEAMLYIIPISLWVAVHLWPSYSRHGLRLTLKKSIMLGTTGIVVLVASVPMLTTAYEMSLTNKTLIQGYQDLNPYFPSMRVFLLGLSLPGFTGSVFPSMPAPFSFGQEATLSYVFAGSLSAAFLAIVVFDRIVRRRRAEAFWLVFSLVMLLGYTYGAGSPIHRILCQIFPFLVDIAHNYYGLHLLYLLSAFGVAAGLQLLANGRYWPTFCAMQLLILAMTMYFALRVQLDPASGLIGSLQDFGIALKHDSRWLAICSGLILAATAVILLVRRSSLRLLERPVHVAAFVAVSMLVILDLLRPLLGAGFVPNVHFVPNASWVTWASDPLGGFRPSEPIVDYLREHADRTNGPLRVLPIYPKPGGWQSNALLPLNVKLLHQPGDSSGNRAISARLDTEPSPGVIRNLIADFGVNAFWVSRWGMEPWAQTLAQMPELEKTVSAEYGGDLYRVRPQALDLVPRTIGENHWALPWHAPRAAAEQGLVTRHWSFASTAPAGAVAGTNTVELPLMWHAFFVVEQDGKRVEFSGNQDGRLVAHDLAPGAGPVTVRYPTPAISTLVVMAALAYLGVLAVLVSCLALRLAEHVGIRRRSTTGARAGSVNRQTGAGKPCPDRPRPVARPTHTSSGSPLSLIRSTWSNRQLIVALVRRDIASRYRGSALGMLWTILNPLLMLSIYTFVFSEVFGMRWGGGSHDSPRDFALMLFAGMLLFTLFSECVNRAPALIVANPNLVKRVVFPLEIQSWVVLLSGLFQTAVNLAVLLAAFLVLKGPPHWTVLLIPVVILPLSLVILGLVWFLSSLGVYLRDTGQVVGHLVVMAMFLSPLFYPVTAIPERFRPLFFLNPLTMLMEEARKLLVLGHLPNWSGLGLYTIMAALFAAFGFWWFQRTRRGFADVI